MREAASLGAPPRSTAGVTRIGRFFFRYRDYLAPLGLILILASTRPRPLFASERLDVWLDAAGMLIAVIGQAIRVVVIGYAYIQRGGAKKQLAASRLVCEGVYAHSRNPMYLGNLLLLTGLAIIYHSPIVYLVMLPVYILAILAIIKSEEEFLRGKFGDEYEDYCRRVNRFLPRLQGLRSTFAAMRFDWRRVVRKEYGTTFAWISVALALIAWAQLDWYGAQAARSVLITLGTVWCGVFACYAVARWMKKTHRLASSD
jgi:protein-S-isoprenylcysteine O-methyltransferase Ste14